MAKHTPEPWAYENCQPNRDEITGPDGQIICELSNSALYLRTGCRPGDAELIVNAPLVKRWLDQLLPACLESVRSADTEEIERALQGLGVLQADQCPTCRHEVIHRCAVDSRRAGDCPLIGATSEQADKILADLAEGRLPDDGGNDG
ncbi:MAG: hypothetical protein OXC11_02380 [Rhodospirillales bacterium]|nr:hypothetical protein [Rhodospirillales bacterium]